MRIPTRSYLGGRWVDGAGKPLLSVNPADVEDVVFEGRRASVEQVEQAIEAASNASPDWAKTPPPERARYMARVAQLARARAPELARALVRDVGKTLADARAEIDKGAGILERFAAEGWRAPGQLLAGPSREMTIASRRAPLGVVGLVTPWNVPFALPCWKLAPALVAGNTAVLKPSSLAPAMSLVLASLFEEAELPAGVLNVVTGSGAMAGRVMAAHPAVRGLSFTGSPGSRARLYDEISGRLARFQWNAPAAGGGTAVVVAGADLDAAAAGVLFGAFTSAGQRCTATSRLLVEDSVADAMCERLVSGAAAMKVGDGLDPETDMGPVIHGAALDRLQAAVAAARAEGAILCGGERVGGDRGFFFAPTIVDRVDPSASIARLELFGPVLAVSRVACFEEALAVANDGPHQLSGSLYCRDTELIARYVEGARAPMIRINTPTVGGEPLQPYGGVRAAGATNLDGDGLDFFTEIRTVFVASGRADRHIYY